MLIYKNSRFHSDAEFPVAQGATVDAEGQILVADYNFGDFGVKKSTGAATEKFVGVSKAQQMTLTALPEYAEFVVDATLAATLLHTPIAGSAGARNETNGVALVVAAAASPTDVGVVGTAVTFHTSMQGKRVTISYRYVPTTIEAQAIQGHIPAGGAAALALNRVGVAKAAEIYTTEYDTTVDWASNGVVKCGANGLFTIGGTGQDVPHAYVVQVPTASNPVLGVSFSA